MISIYGNTPCSQICALGLICLARDKALRIAWTSTLHHKLLKRCLTGRSREDEERREQEQEQVLLQCALKEFQEIVFSGSCLGHNNMRS